jgi:glycyl-tRNA synthetase beta chain
MATVSSRPLLVELLVEELPPKALALLGSAFAESVFNGLVRFQLTVRESSFQVYATPRRLAVLVQDVVRQGVERTEDVKLMPVNVGLTADGQPTPALLKRLSALDVDSSVVPSLERRKDGKAEVLFLNRKLKGVLLAEALQSVVDEAIAKLPIPKVMQYQLADGWTSVSFVRPAHSLVALHGEEIVPVRALGLDAGRTTHGHRFEGSRAPIVVRDATSYATQLRDEGAVIASFDERRQEIRRQLDAAAAAADLAPIDDDALLDEVTALVELPNVLTCRFDAEFLAVPPECLVLTMKANQRYFPLLERDGRLTNRFLVVSNIAPADPGRITEGNERVVRPRLADAKFFYDQDRKKTLASRVPDLDKVVYHAKLGSQGQRVGRLRTIARWVAPRIGADAERADRAAFLAKADLLTDMVGEFPELQGIMGGYYARHDGEPDDVATAIADQYVNRRGADQDKAQNLVGVSLLLADRLETLVGIWGIGLKPTGEKDPYALRRHALTVIHAFSLLGAFRREPLELGLRDLLETAYSSFAPIPLAPDAVAEVESFVYERYFQQLATLHDTRAVDAVISIRPALHDIVGRVLAVREFLALPEAPALAAANKRVGNILKKSDAPAATVDAALLSEPAERALAAALRDVGTRADQAYRAGEYARSLSLLAGLKPAVEAFFDSVMVNVDSPVLRANRLALLAALRATMNRVADLSVLAV